MTSIEEWKSNSSVQKFQEYLKLPSAHPNVNYEGCINFLKKQAEELNLPYEVHIASPKNPIIIITWEGKNPSLPSVLLNSHMDVVAVYPNSWKYPPFDAHITEDGKIYGRGSQDMKCVGIQYLEAIKRLKQNGKQLLRTIHISFMPDEEMGGMLGIQKFIKTDEIKKLNVGVSLDEGAASNTNDFYIFYAERSIWHVIITCPGQSGHGSLLLPNTAGEKVRYVIDKFMDYRETEKQKLQSNQSLTVSDVTSINLTRIYGGVQTNVVPESLTVVFDIRLAIDVNHNDFEDMINNWCKEAGDGVTIKYEMKSPKVEPTKLNDDNKFWKAFKKSTDDLGINLKKLIFPGGTDSRFLRDIGIPTFGFSPMNNIEPLLHQHNEYIHADLFLKGIDIYEKIIESVANVS